MDLVIRWTAFPLHPETPPEGRRLEDLFAGRGFDIPAMVAHLQSIADDLGLPFTTRTMTYNSRQAQELGKWAEDQGRGEIFHRLVFEAYFAKGFNIAEWEILGNLASAAGLDPVSARAVLDQGRYRAAVDRDWQRSRALGVTAVPTFLMAGQRLVGAQPYKAIRQLALAAGAAPKST